MSIENKQLGFSLVELMVSVTIFVIIVVMGMGAVITSNHSYNKTMRTSVGSDSISFVIESMARRIRTGKNYTCKNDDCKLTQAKDSFEFIDQDGLSVEYYLVGETLKRKINGDEQNLTDPTAVAISRLEFFGEGDAESYTDGDTIQPRVTMIIEGEVPLRGGEVKDFRLQTSITQRKLDL